MTPVKMVSQMSGCDFSVQLMIHLDNKSESLGTRITYTNTYTCVPVQVHT